MGDARVRIALEQGQVRLTLLDGSAEDAAELLRDAGEALTERGFDLGGDGSQRRSGDPRDEVAASATGVASTRPARRGSDGLRL